jgi:hypothetical protein
MMFLFLIRLTWCCTSTLLSTALSAIYTNDDPKVKLLPNYVKMDLARLHAMILTSPPPLSHLRHLPKWGTLGRAQDRAERLLRSVMMFG